MNGAAIYGTRPWRQQNETAAGAWYTASPSGSVNAPPTPPPIPVLSTQASLLSRAHDMVTSIGSRGEETKLTLKVDEAYVAVRISACMRRRRRRGGLRTCASPSHMHAISKIDTAR